MSLIVFLVALATRVDDFDLYTQSVLAKLPADGAEEVPRITLAQITRAPSVLGRASGCFLVVRTDEGNWSKLVVRQAIRKHGAAEVPIVVLERFRTLRRGSDAGRLAAGTNVYLFDGFRFNLDIGQVVPDDGGGDIEFHRDSAGGYLQSSAGSKLFLISKSLVERDAARGETQEGPVTPADFAGKFRLFASGRWSGRLVLRATESGQLTGSYVSDQTGGEYPIKGSIAQPAHRIRFAVELPATRQEFDGYLWTHGKNVLAGTTTLGGSQFGFVAVREGTDLVPKDEP